MSHDFISNRGSFRQQLGFAAGQGRKADTAQDEGLSALPSSAALIGVDRLLAFSTSFPFITRFYLDFTTPELSSETPKAMLFSRPAA